MTATTELSELDAIRALEAEYRQKQQREADLAEATRHDFTEELRAGVQRCLDNHLLQLVPFAQIDALSVESGSELPYSTSVPISIPEHAPITLHLSRSYGMASEWTLGDIRNSPYSRLVVFSVWNASGYYREFNQKGDLAEVLAYAYDRYPAWVTHQKKQQEQQERENAPAASEPPKPEPEPFHITDAEYKLILAFREFVADSRIDGSGE